MKENSALFEIISSLSKSEKRYINLAFSYNKDKNYLKLFNELRYHSEKKLAYNDSIVKEKFKNEKFTRQLTFTKNYLSELIFRALDSYYGNHTVEFKIKNLLTKARIQYDKALYKSFFKTIESGKKLCGECERLTQYLQFLEMEKVVVMKKISPGRDEARILDEEIEILNKLRNLNEYEQIINMLTGMYMDKGRLRESKTESLVRKIKDNYIMMNDKRAMTKIAGERFYFAWQLIADIEGNYEEMVENINNRFRIVHENPKVFGERLFNIMQDVVMYILIFYPRAKLDINGKYYTDILNSCTGKSITEQITLFLIESAVRFSNLKNLSTAGSLVESIRELEEKMALYKDKMDNNYEILIYSTVARVLAYKGNFAEASVYLNRLLNHPGIFIRKDVELYSKLINIIVHYELKNFDYLEYLIKSIYRYLLKRDNLYRFEKLIINFFRRLTQITNDDELLESFEIIKGEILELKKDRFERNALTFFDFPGWIDKKISEMKKSNAGPV